MTIFWFLLMVMVLYVSPIPVSGLIAQDRRPPRESGDGLQEGRSGQGRSEEQRRRGRGREERREPSEFEKKHRALITSIQDLYLDHYGELEQIQTLRKQGTSSDTDLQSRVGKLKNTLSNKIEKVRKKIQSLQPSGRLEKKRVKKARELFEYFVDLQDKMLNGWPPEGTSRKKLRKMSRRERLREGLSRPSIVRKKFLTELMQERSQYGGVRIGEKLKTFQSKMDTLYWKMLETYTTGLQRFHDARTPDEETGKNGEKIAIGSERVQEALSIARASWSDFWSENREDWKQIGSGLNRSLMLFRGLKYLPSIQSISRAELIRMKKRYASFEKFDRKKIFADPKKRKTFMIKLVKWFFEKIASGLMQNTNEVKKVFEVGLPDVNRLDPDRMKRQELINSIRKQKRRMRGSLEKLDQLDDRLKQVRIKPLRTLAGRLENDFGENEKRIGRVVKKITNHFDSIKHGLKKGMRSLNNLIDFAERDTYPDRSTFNKRIKEMTKPLTSISGQEMLKAIEQLPAVMKEAEQLGLKEE